MGRGVGERGRTKESEMMVLRPAAILAVDKGTVMVLSGGSMRLRW